MKNKSRKQILKIKENRKQTHKNDPKKNKNKK